MYRPLSPHLLIYKPQFSSVLSVFHRVTGVVLSLGLLFVLFSLTFFRYHITFYPIYLISCYFNTYLAWVLVAILVILLASFFYHLSNGIRHLIWDKAWLLDNTKIQTSAYLVLFLTLLFSGAVLYLVSVLGV